MHADIYALHASRLDATARHLGVRRLDGRHVTQKGNERIDYTIPKSGHT